MKRILDQQLQVTLSFSRNAGIMTALDTARDSYSILCRSCINRLKRYHVLSNSLWICFFRLFRAFRG